MRARRRRHEAGCDALAVGGGGGGGARAQPGMLPDLGYRRAALGVYGEHTPHKVAALLGRVGVGVGFRVGPAVSIYLSVYRSIDLSICPSDLSPCATNYLFVGLEYPKPYPKPYPYPLPYPYP